MTQYHSFSYKTAKGVERIDVYGIGLADAQRLLGNLDHVQQTSDGKFKIGDIVRPNKFFIDNCCSGLDHAQALAYAKGVKIIDIGPADRSLGTHPIELEAPYDTLIIDSDQIEKV
jgi:hypothetical protein